MPLGTRPLLGAAALVLAVACGAPARPTVVTPSPAVSPTISVAASPGPTSTAAPTTATSPILRFSLTDVRSGERFTLGGFTGKTVIVQGMAVW